MRETYEAKEKSVGEQTLRDFEKFFMLQTVDTLWKDHLLALDHLKEGIGLRGYGQRDPLVEYKKESFQLFEAMKEGVEEQILQYLFRFEVAQAPGRAPAPRPRRRRSARAARALAAAERLGLLAPRRRRAREAPPEGTEPPVAGFLRPDGGRRFRRLHGEGHGPEGRPERSVPVRLREEVQEVPRSAGLGAAAG